MTVVTRFAPSPTGFLHIGGARTALFNWLYARHHGGVFRLRIEDTDRARSTKEAIEAIIDGLKWLGLNWDDETVFQFARAPRHAEVAMEMLKQGKAYYCYCTPEELDQMREAAKAAGKPMKYDGRWRDRDPKDAPAGAKPVVRLKAPTSGETVVQDKVQGEVRVANEQLDDMVLLRSDGAPTYMHAVVVDDHDMGITDVIRGDDHLTNTFRQLQIYQAMGWTPPSFAHIPLIHGPDGAKLSKRHGALGVEAYRDMGYLPEALRNYLLRLGWGHGDDEIISTEQAIQWFDLDAVGRGPSRFDFAKLENLSGHYIRSASDEALIAALKSLLPHLPQEKAHAAGLSDDEWAKLTLAMPGLKERAKTLVELLDSAQFLFTKRPVEIDEKAAKLLNPAARDRLAALLAKLAEVGEWTAPAIEAAVRAHAEETGAKLGDLAQPLRAALTGRTTSPGIFDVIFVLGKDEALGRIRDQTLSKK
ncbi:MAG: glutamate--tRNA ligase [Rhodomicrobium sp.]|nr:glutamate--tRNA ligase [Rhodomicrobium sp.]